MSQTEETSSKTPTVPLEGKALKDAVRAQMEYYFSPQNLANDSFLVSKMNDERYVPVELIASFERIKSLTTDLPLIVESLEDSDQVEVSADGKMIRLKETPKRTTLIIRDLPTETTEQVTSGSSRVLSVVVLFHSHTTSPFISLGVAGAL